MPSKKISVIIPAYNAEEIISRTIKAVTSQKFPPKDYEIIVVNDGSTDNTKRIVSRFKNVKLVNIVHGGAAKARNSGVINAKGNIVAFTDAGCIPKKNWIKELMKPYKDENIVGVAGTYDTLNKESLIARFFGYEIEQRHKKMKKLKEIDFVGTYNCAYRRSIFMELNGFSESFGHKKKAVANAEDPEFSFRMKKKGYKIVFQPKAIVSGDHPDTLWKYLMKKKSRAYWKVLLYKKHPLKTFGDAYTPKTLFPQIFLTGLFMAFIFLSVFELKLFYLSLISLFLSLALNLNFYRFVWKKEKKVALFSPVIFLLRNIFSAFGIAHGIIDFFSKK